MPVNVLLVSSESDCEPVKDSLGALGHQVTCAKTPPTAFKTASRNRPGLVIVDLVFRHRALKLIRTLCDGRFRPAVLAIAVPGHPDIASSALSLGVTDILTRPINLGHLTDAAANAVELAQFSPEPVPPSVPEEVERVFGDSEIMQSILGTVQLVAPLDCSILLVGEVGTGRDSVAETIHALGARSPRPFVTIDCAAGDPDRLERDLLAQLSGGARGRKRGALSPRPPSRAGMTSNDETLPRAPRAKTSEGTLYLQQVDRLTPHLQDVLMHVLEANHSPVEGSSDTGAPRMRLVSSSTPSVKEVVELGRFRKDLLERLATVRLDLPPLRGRSQDIPLLAAYFLKQACDRNQLATKTFARGALTLISALPWHGNARELRAFVERLAVVVPRGVILQEDVLEHVDLEGSQTNGQADESLREARARFERDYIVRVLQRHHGRMGPAAEALGLERTNLYRKMKRLGIDANKKPGSPFYVPFKI